MTKKYSQEELNQILLSKQLNEFYLAILENRQELLTDEEYEEIIKRNDNVYSGATKDEVDAIYNKLHTNKKTEKIAPILMKIIYSMAQVRHMAILTMIDNDVYDIGSAKFEDLRRSKIIHFDNLTNYYDETNARTKVFTPEEEPQLPQNKVLLDVDDESIIYAYESNHINQKESDDLTSAFLNESKENPYTLKKTTDLN